jgi:hypothetical protein
MTGREVFDIAINLLDEQNESSGETLTADTKEYQLRTVRLLNSILPRLCVLTGTTFTALVADSDAMPVSDAISSGVASYELAALIAQTDGDMDIADRMRRDAENNFAEIRTRQEPAEWEDITDVYGGIEYGSGDYEE